MRKIIFFFGVFLLSAPVFAEGVSIDFGSSSGTLAGNIFHTMALLTVISLAPSILMMVTSFTRIVVTFSFLRTALGLQQSPPNVVLVSLALFMTFFIMAPTFEASYTEGVAPYLEERIDTEEAWKKATDPFKTFMLSQVREKDLKLFIDMSKQKIETRETVPLQVLVPAFMISELRHAFELGFLLFLPFLVIDMVVSSILMAMGMMMLPPVTISLPFKIIFFVLVDGWHMVSGALMRGFEVLPPG